MIPFPPFIVMGEVFLVWHGYFIFKGSGWLLVRAGALTLLRMDYFSLINLYQMQWEDAVANFYSCKDMQT